MSTLRTTTSHNLLRASARLAIAAAMPLLIARLLGNAWVSVYARPNNPAIGAVMDYIFFVAILATPLPFAETLVRECSRIGRLLRQPRYQARRTGHPHPSTPSDPTTPR